MGKATAGLGLERRHEWPGPKVRRSASCGLLPHDVAPRTHDEAGRGDDGAIPFCDGAGPDDDGVIPPATGLMAVMTGRFPLRRGWSHSRRKCSHLRSAWLRRGGTQPVTVAVGLVRPSTGLAAVAPGSPAYQALSCSHPPDGCRHAPLNWPQRQSGGFTYDGAGRTHDADCRARDRRSGLPPVRVDWADLPVLPVAVRVPCVHLRVGSSRRVWTIRRVAASRPDRWLPDRAHHNPSPGCCSPTGQPSSRQMFHVKQRSVVLEARRRRGASWLLPQDCLATRRLRVSTTASRTCVPAATRGVCRHRAYGRAFGVVASHPRGEHRWRRTRRAARCSMRWRGAARRQPRRGPPRREDQPC
ncbi:hypothetical protein QE410_003299 [Microbacterium sp. SORGH_AS 1204]|nr:hypothetical protein [Microbacterium sp. SORGH_AS_1204]